MGPSPGRPGVMIEPEEMQRLIGFNRPDDLEPKAEMSPEEFLRREALHYAAYEADIRERYQKIHAVRAGWLTARYSPYEGDWEHELTDKILSDEYGEGDDE